MQQSPSSTSGSTKRSTTATTTPSSRVIVLPVQSSHGVPYADLTPFHLYLASNNDDDPVYVQPDADVNIGNDAKCKLNYIRLATHVFQATVSLKKPCLNVVVRRLEQLDDQQQASSSSSSSPPSSSSLSASTRPSQNEHVNNQIQESVTEHWKDVGYDDDYPFGLIKEATNEASTLTTPPNNKNNIITTTDWVSRFHHVAVGGTFDRLHAGHRLLLTAAAWAAAHTLHIGITGDALLARKTHRTIIADVDARAHAAKCYAQLVVPGIPLVKTSVLLDGAGASATDPHISALVVSNETLLSARTINTTRIQSGFRPFSIILVDVLKTKHDVKVSSTALRNNEVTSKQQ